jgi:hypothetical protein
VGGCQLTRSTQPKASQSLRITLQYHYSVRWVAGDCPQGKRRAGQGKAGQNRARRRASATHSPLSLPSHVRTDTVKCNTRNTRNTPYRLSVLIVPSCFGAGGVEPQPTTRFNSLWWSRILVAFLWLRDLSQPYHSNLQAGSRFQVLLSTPYFVPELCLTNSVKGGHLKTLSDS